VVVAAAAVDVRKVEADGLEADDGVAEPRLRVRDLSDLQHLGAAEAGEGQCSHAAEDSPNPL
jgi:hypothetical protein